MNYDKLSAAQIAVKIREKGYVSRAGANRAIGRSPGLTDTQRNNLRKLVSEKYGWKRVSVDNLNFDSIKDSILHDYYPNAKVATSAISRSARVTKTEKTKLLKLIEDFYNGKANGREKKVRANYAKKTKVSKATKPKREVDPRVMRQGDYITVFLDSTNDLRFVDKVLVLGRAAIDAHSTLPALINAIEIRRKELKAS
jgi:hypothetical protein